MSYILDALRKAEHERHLGQVPTLASPAAPHQSVQRHIWPWLALIGFGLNTILIAVIFLNRTPSHPAQPATIRVTSSSSSLPISSPVITPAIPISQPMKPLEVPLKPQPVIEKSPPASATVREIRRESPPAPIAREIRREPAQKPVPTRAVVTKPAEKAPAPLLETLNARQRRGIADMNLDVHVYSRDIRERFVVINGVRYREGERLREGAILLAVTTEGVILQQGRQRFRLAIRR